MSVQNNDIDIDGLDAPKLREMLRLLLQSGQKNAESSKDAIQLVCHTHADLMAAFSKASKDCESLEGLPEDAQDAVVQWANTLLGTLLESCDRVRTACEDWVSARDDAAFGLATELTLFRANTTVPSTKSRSKPRPRKVNMRVLGLPH
ncbi:hypothetical protein ACT6QH_04075 [Xanthobacter sp. TB0139]|uniref:hypothetical protein n=1 Tax=Xanthobacter sp. TB0139 TaxID=3459178 RepID=UPI00403A2171